MEKVFISHSSKDRGYVKSELLPLLNGHGIQTWFSVEDIKSAAEWEKEIRDNLRRCDWVIVVLSPNAVASDWIKAEVNWALDKRPGKVVPIMYRSCDPEDLHIKLPLIQYINYQQDAERAKRQLLSIWDIPYDSIGTTPNRQTKAWKMWQSTMSMAALIFVLAAISSIVFIIRGCNPNIANGPPSTPSKTNILRLNQGDTDSAPDPLSDRNNPKVLGSQSIPLSQPKARSHLKARFTFNPTSGVAPLIVNFADSSSKDAEWRHWDFGDGTSLDSACATHTFEQNGNYTIRLTVARNGDTAYSERRIVVESNPMDEILPSVSEYDRNSLRSILEDTEIKFLDENVEALCPEATTGDSVTGKTMEFPLPSGKRTAYVMKCRLVSLSDRDPEGFGMVIIVTLLCPYVQIGPQIDVRCERACKGGVTCCYYDNDWQLVFSCEDIDQNKNRIPLRQVSPIDSEFLVITILDGRGAELTHEYHVAGLNGLYSWPWASLLSFQTICGHQQQRGQEWCDILHETVKLGIGLCWRGSTPNVDDRLFRISIGSIR